MQYTVLYFSELFVSFRYNFKQSISSITDYVYSNFQVIYSVLYVYASALFVVLVVMQIVWIKRLKQKVLRVKFLFKMIPSIDILKYQKLK